MNTFQENTSGCDAQEWRTNRMHWGCLGSKMGPIFKMSHDKPLWPKTAICPRSKWGLRENFTIFDIVFAKSTCQDGFGEWPLFSFFDGIHGDLFVGRFTVELWVQHQLVFRWFLRALACVATNLAAIWNRLTARRHWQLTSLSSLYSFLAFINFSKLPARGEETATFYSFLTFLHWH